MPQPRGAHNSSIGVPPAPAAAAAAAAVAPPSARAAAISAAWRARRSAARRRAPAVAAASSTLSASRSAFEIASTRRWPRRTQRRTTSVVCGCTPASAATRTSAASAPSDAAARIPSKTRWPGVSTKAKKRGAAAKSGAAAASAGGTGTSAGRTDWVIPPGSRATSSLPDSASRKVVLPWSTCASTATTAVSEATGAPPEPRASCGGSGSTI